MAWILVPSLTALLGRKAFWPGNISPERPKPDATAAPPAPVADRAAALQRREAVLTNSY